MKSYYVYIITNWNNKVLYTGVTNNLERRIFEHKNKLVPGFSNRYNLNKLVFFEEFNKIDDAIVAEKKIKGWVRIKKLNLVESRNPNWVDLTEQI
jgi:putative endonuclease